MASGHVADSRTCGGTSAMEPVFEAVCSRSCRICRHPPPACTIHPATVGNVKYPIIPDDEESDIHGIGAVGNEFGSVSLLYVLLSMSTCILASTLLNRSLTGEFHR